MTLEACPEGLRRHHAFDTIEGLTAIKQDECR